MTLSSGPTALWTFGAEEGRDRPALGHLWDPRLCAGVQHLRHAIRYVGLGAASPQHLSHKPLCPPAPGSDLECGSLPPCQD